MVKSLKELLESESLHVQQLDQLVQESIAEEETLSNRLAELEHDEKVTLGQQLADKVAEFGGSWIFIISFGSFVTLWIFSNGIIARNNWFDPYPFILLNLILSCLAAIQAPI